MHDLMILYFAGLTGIWKAIPIGMMLKVPPILVGLLTLAGSCTTVTMLYLCSGLVRNFIDGKCGRERIKRKRLKVERLLAKYGIIGLGLIGPVAVGPAATIISGILISRSKRELLIWTIIGILLWTSVLTAAASAGLNIFRCCICVDGWNTSPAS